MRTTNITLDNELSSNLLDMCESMPRDNVLYPFLSMLLERYESLTIKELERYESLTDKELDCATFQSTFTFTIFFFNNVSNFFLGSRSIDDLFEGYEELQEALFDQVVLQSQLVIEEEDMISEMLNDFRCQAS